MKYGSTSPIKLKDDKFNPLAEERSGLLALPGKYRVKMEMVVRNGTKQLAEPVDFNVVPLNNTTIPAADRKELVAFQQKTSELAGVMMGAENFAEDLQKRIEYIKQALNNTPGASPELFNRANQVSKDIDDVLFTLNGMKPKASAEENPPAQEPLNDRLSVLIYTQWRSTSNVTDNQKRDYEILMEELPPVLAKIKKVNDVDIKYLQDELDKAGAPWTPGRIPVLPVK